MATDFLTLQNRIAATLIDTPQLTLAEIPRAINAAVRTAEELHNFRHMKRTGADALAVTTTAGSNVLVPELIEGSSPLAPLWKERVDDPFWLYWLAADRQQNIRMNWIPSPSQARILYDQDDAEYKGKPEELLVEGNQIMVYPKSDGLSEWPDAPAGEYRIRIPYWSYSAELVDPNDTNWWTANAESYLYFFGCAWGFLTNRDFANAQLWGQRSGFNLANSTPVRDNRGVMTGELGRLVSVDKRSKLTKSISIRPRSDTRASFRERRLP